MTKQHFIHAATIVRSIVNGEWTADFPAWADATRSYGEVQPYDRAVVVAEAFITLFTAFNPRFNHNSFLTACGLKERP